MYTEETFRISMALLDEMKRYTDGTTWMTWNLLQVPYTKHQCFRALRLLQSTGFVDSRITGEGSTRVKEYRAHRPGLRAMATMDSEAVNAQA